MWSSFMLDKKSVGPTISSMLCPVDVMPMAWIRSGVSISRRFPVMLCFRKMSAYWAKSLECPVASQSRVVKEIPIIMYSLSLNFSFSLTLFLSLHFSSSSPHSFIFLPSLSPIHSFYLSLFLPSLSLSEPICISL